MQQSMQPLDLISFWGPGNLLRWPEEATRMTAIPATSKRFLSEVGLPLNETWTLRFEAVGDRPHRDTRKPHYVRLGFDGDMPLYLDESRRGQVLAVSGDGSERFVNQSVELFGQCLALFENYRRVVRSVPDEQADPIIASTEAELHKADPAAFKNDENWWPLVVEQMNHGLL